MTKFEGEPQEGLAVGETETECRTLVGVIRCRSFTAFSPNRTVLENTILTTVLAAASTVVSTPVPYTSEVEHRVTMPL